MDFACNGRLFGTRREFNETFGNDIMAARDKNASDQHTEVCMR